MPRLDYISSALAAHSHKRNRVSVSDMQLVVVLFLCLNGRSVYLNDRSVYLNGWSHCHNLVFTLRSGWVCRIENTD